MQGLFRRPSGIYFLRISVPKLLRNIFGKCEVIDSTGTTELAIAKMVAGSQAAQWRQRFFNAGRLASLASPLMTNDQELIRIAQGHPLLHTDGHLTLQQASNASGLSSSVLLKEAASTGLSLFIRAAHTRGYLVPLRDLDLADPEIGSAGGHDLPDESRLPASAVAHISTGMLKIAVSDLPGVATALLASSNPFPVHAFDVPEKPGLLFLPTTSINASPDSVELSCAEVEGFRRLVAATVDPKRLREAKALQKTTLMESSKKAGAKANELLSTALAAYIANGVRQHVAKEGEIIRISNGCSLLIELEGDLPLTEITTELLRDFRDNKLSKVPANENKVRLIHGTTSVAQSMNAVIGKDWPIMSIAERGKRMQWICSWFKWLKADAWIEADPAMVLRGESVLNAAQRRTMKTKARDDQAREVLSENDLNAIFSAVCFKTGRGELTAKGLYHRYSPLHYWLPLLGLYLGGGRINELCQLHLSNIRQSSDGAWYVDFNEDAADQNLKTVPSLRMVPIPDALLNLGFDKWHTALVANGYKRLFPELKFDKEKGYGKSATKWFSKYMKALGIPRNGKKTFHSFRHNFTNALPGDTPTRMGNQLTGHARGDDVRQRTYLKDDAPEATSEFVNRLDVRLPDIARFDIDEGLKAIIHALARKTDGPATVEDVGTYR